LEFARNFHKFKYLEEIDLRKNEKITSIGKIYLFLHLFDRRNENQNLNYFYIESPATDEHCNLIDNGMVGYFLRHLRQKYISSLYIKRITSNIISSQRFCPSVFSYNSTLI
jgi:hypothetical protein